MIVFSHKKFDYKNSKNETSKQQLPFKKENILSLLCNPII